MFLHKIFKQQIIFVKMVWMNVLFSRENNFLLTRRGLFHIREEPNNYIVSVLFSRLQFRHLIIPETSCLTNKSIAKLEVFVKRK
jgi:hypothetical protein